MKVLAQCIERQISEYNRRRLNGIIDFPVFFSAFYKVIAHNKSIVGYEEEKYLGELWREYEWGSLSKAMSAVPKPKGISEDEKIEYLKRVRELYNARRHQVEVHLLEFVNRNYKFINKFLAPYKNIESMEVSEETMGLDIIGVLS